jgi:type IV pilus assembly protein PilE
MRQNSGFTLLELMIVVAVIGILGAIAYPSYSDHVRRGKLAEALATLGDTRTKMEQFFLDNRTYIGADGANMPCNATVINGAAKHFTFACSNLGAGTYTITATGAAAQGMSGFTYTIDQANVRSTTITGVSGWTGSTTCWVRAKGGVC